jgi:hypothetical protein
MGSGSGFAASIADRTEAAFSLWLVSASVISHSQQSLQRRHFSHRWLSQASLVHRAQMRVDSSPQMLHRKGIYFFFPDLEPVE